MVTKLGYGAMELRYVDQNQAERLLKGGIEAGINEVETSPDYGPSEDWIGKFISAQRDEYYLATKCGCNVPYPAGENTARHIWTGHRYAIILSIACSDSVLNILMCGRYTVLGRPN